jgi:hypothetical protein
VRVLKPFADTVAKTAVDTAAKSGVKLGASGYAKEIGKTAVTQGATEGLQDFSGSIAAVLRTDSEWDEAKIESLARAAAYEGLVAGILGVPLGGVSAYTDSIAAQRVYEDSNFTPEDAVALMGEDGELSLDFRQLTPVDGAAKQPGFWSLAASTLTGNATSKSRKRLSWSEKAQTLLDSFNTPFNRKKPGQFTVNEKARAVEGELQTLAKAFNKASEQDRHDAWNAKAEGIKLDTAASQALWEILNVKIPELASSMSNGEIDTSTGLFIEETYLPILNDMDWKKVTDDAASIDKAIADMDANGKTDKEIAATVKALKEQSKSYKETGNHMSYSYDRQTQAINEAILKQAKKAKEKGKPLSKKSKAALKARLSKKARKDKRDSPLNLDRSLHNLSQKYLNSYRRSSDPRGTLNSHIRMISEYLAMTDTFGVDNRLFDDAVADIAIDAIDNNQDFNPDIVDELYDVLRTQQRIHLKPLKSEAVRTAQNNTRAATNTILLGLSSLVSIPELLVIFMNTGGKASLQGLAQTVLRARDSKGMRLASENLGYTVANATDHGINRTGEESFEVKAWESAFIKFTGLPYLQYFLTTWAARSYDVHIKQLLKELNTDISPSRRSYIQRKLAEGKIDVEKATDWAVNQDFSMESDYFKKEYVPAIIGLTQDTIVDPHPIDKPLWMNDEHYLLISQLKGFMTVFTNRVMGRWSSIIANSPEGNRVLATRVAPYVAMYIAAQVAMQGVREVIKEGDLDDWDEKGMGERIFNAFGYLGGMAYLIDIINSVRFRSDPLTAVAGPVPSKAINLLGTGADPETALENIVKELFPNVPFKGLILEAFYGD